jgi:type IV secretory pathway VirB6-like protein
MWDYFHQLLGIKQIMSTLADIQASQAATDAAVASVKTDVEALLAKIAAFPAAGTLTAAQQAAIDDIAAHATAINTALGVVASEANPPATPTP